MGEKSCAGCYYWGDQSKQCLVDDPDHEIFIKKVYENTTNAPRRCPQCGSENTAVPSVGMRCCFDCGHNWRPCPMCGSECLESSTHYACPNCGLIEKLKDAEK